MPGLREIIKKVLNKETEVNTESTAPKIEYSPRSPILKAYKAYYAR